jgi:membrane associated rhomboid family serine protease
MITTYSLIGITVLISMYAFSNPELMRKFILSPYIVNTRGEYYRFLTSGFLHKDHMHLIFNMITLYFFGPIIQMVFTAIFGSMGAFYYVALYLLAIIVSDIPSFFKYRNIPGYSSLGASGGVSAVVFAFILFLPLEKINLYLIFPVPGFILGALYIMYSYYQSKKSSDNINHDAHLYGALFGLIFCIILYPPSVQNFLDQLKNWRLF